MKRMVKAQSFSYINRINTSKADSSSQHKNSPFIPDANTDACSVTVTRECRVKVTLHTTMLGRLPTLAAAGTTLAATPATDGWEKTGAAAVTSETTALAAAKCVHQEMQTSFEPQGHSKFASR